MLNSVNQNKKVSYGAVKDVVPQNVNVKLPQSVQNYDAKEQVKDSMVGSVSSGLTDTKGMKPWQIALSVAGAIAVVFGGSALIRHFVKNNGIFKAGEKLDDIYNGLKDKKIGKALSKVKNFFKKNVTSKIKNSSLGELYAKDEHGIRSGMMRPKVTMAQSQLRGSTSECSDEICDIFEQMLHPKKSRFKFIDKIREKVLGVGEKIGYVRKAGKRFPILEGEADGTEAVRRFIKEAGHEKEADELIDALKEYCKDTGNVDLKIGVKDKFMPVLKDFFGIKGEGSIAEIMEKVKNKDFYQRISMMGLTHDVDVLTTVKNMMILDGQGAKTPLGKLFQKFVVKAGEAPTNGVISRSKFGLGIGVALYVGIMNKIQKAKKGEKIATAGEEVTTDIGGYMMLPVNALALYGISSLKNFGLTKEGIKNYRTQLGVLQQKFKEASSSVDKQAIMNEFKALKKSTYGSGNLLQKIIRIPGKIMSIGLESGPGKGKLSGKLGGTLRFLVFMFVISATFMKPIRSLATKLFGETTETKEEKAKAAEKKAQKKQQKALRKARKQNPDAALPMSQEELAQKLMANPQILQKLQSDPQLLDQVSKNPQLLVQMLNETQTTVPQSQVQAQNTTSSGSKMSPSLAQRLNTNNNAPANNQVAVNTPQVFINNQPINPQVNSVQSVNPNPVNNGFVVNNNAPLNNNLVNNTAPQIAQSLEKKNKKQAEVAEPDRKYIPSSNPTQAPEAASTLTPEQRASINRALANADDVERSASQILL